MTLLISLMASAALLGLASAPHCAAMCSAACAAVLRWQGGAVGADGEGRASGGSETRRWLTLLSGRTLGYALGGAVVAASVGTLAVWAQTWPWLRPFWVMLQFAWVLLGLSLLVLGRQPAWLMRFGRRPALDTRRAAVAGRTSEAEVPVRVWPRSTWASGVRTGGAGVAWVLWPCGLLQSALLLSAYAGGAWQGATVMTVFALTSAPGLFLGPWVLQKLRLRPTQMVRLAGLMLALAGGWSLGHGLIMGKEIAPFCVTSFHDMNGRFNPIEWGVEVREPSLIS